MVSGGATAPPATRRDPKNARDGQHDARDRSSAPHPALGDPPRLAEHVPERHEGRRPQPRAEHVEEHEARIRHPRGTGDERGESARRKPMKRATTTAFPPWCAKSASTWARRTPCNPIRSP